MTFRTLLRLGSRPIILPAPLDTLVAGLAAGRSTALFTLAAEIPAAILAKTLGIHVQAAIQWQKISARDWAAHAADVSRRPGHTHGPTGQA